MLMTKEGRPAGAIHEYEQHGGQKTAAIRTRREPALELAREHPPAEIAPVDAAAAIADFHDGIGDACPECLPEG